MTNKHFLNILMDNNMNVIYVCKLSKIQAEGKQIDIPKYIAINFFNVPESNIENFQNTGINICHVSDLCSFEIIDIQPATNVRWSTKLNTFLTEKGENLHEGDLLIFEKLGRSFCVHSIPRDDKKYDALLDLFEKDEKHMLLSLNLESQPEHTENIRPCYRPYITAIKSKPFLLLAGISGTGKSRIVRELARACWDKDSKEYDVQKPINYEMIQVKPNWHDSSELIGYISRISGQPVFIPGEFLKFIVKAWEHPEVPYFLCLDEMNLAPVEQYFAEYLSVIETRKKNNDGKIVTDALIKPEYKNERDEKTNELKPAQWYENLVDTLLAGCSDTNIWALRKQFLTEGISIPQNLIVVGTVNMDETTFSFSRKVLDRAMTIEMNEVDLYSGLTEQHEQIGKLGEKELIGTAVEGVDVYEGYKDVCEKALAYLQAVNNVLNGTPFKIAYRTRNDFLLYVVNNLPYNKDEQGNDLSEDFVIARALDEITSMKILSRIEGDDTKVTNTFLDNLKKTIEEGLKSIYEDFKTEDSVSLLKLKEMKQKLDSGNTSFWS
ncbi:MAG: AAA family ATPase [Prevotella sp.]|nr:AAA family ATPase [Prevotella sp.]